MASTGRSAFSQNGQYYAFCGNDGKLKIWETASGRLKHEYTPNRHLSSPCSVIEWISVSPQSAGNISPSPRKKRRRKSISEEIDHKAMVAMGSMNGKITLYDVAAASVSATLENGHSSTVTAIAWSACAGLITAANDYHIVEWNLQENGIKCKWKSGKAKVTALAILSNGKSLLSAEKIIKWWNLATKQLIRTFTGHANHVTFLHTIQVDNSTSYLISGASADNHLSVWALDKNKNDKASITTLAMQDEATSVSILVAEELQVVVLVTTQSGQAQLFKYQPNGHTKPLKPSLNIAVAADVSQKETVQQIPILAGHLTEDEKLLLAYGSYLNLTFEKVIPDFSDKVQCLIRSERLDTKKSKERKEETISKIKPTAIEEDVEYLAPGIGVPTQKRNRTISGSQLLLKDRLENLSLNADANTPGRIPMKGANMAQLLMQALNSKDKTILTTVLFTKNETVIRNTIAKLPVQAITPLLKELIVMLQGKTYASKIAVMWLQTLIMTHAAHLMSRPDIAEILSPILSFIDAKLALLTAVQRLKGRVSLITGQIAQANEEHNKDITEESLLVYQDPDSSDEGADKDDVDLSSESDDNWEEMSDQDVRDEQDEEDNRSIKYEDDYVGDNDSIHS
ncbi:PREDICTED: WD repeat-containing protein 43 [Wasmannia auropunctata]|uniref:WD repeat-containing protein 43 n=1 Tax=Wasmannia auropunctata TaxID=64793 RepID=UPI0005EE1FC3|nr:PREDICTED: WD repeat-containing protein 43 [Wasmannia auropunctata]XP_011695782.1 PREDICTED: WD repeat-containing protein 43 [Wasmannia auropunctata]